MTDPSDGPAADASTLDEKLGDVPTWITLSAVLLGVLTILLVGAAVAVTRSDRGSGDAAPAATESASRPGPTAAATTAGPLANVECNGTFIVEFARSDPPFEKSSVDDALARIDGAKYLEADQSCSTFSKAGQRLIAYIGPFDDLAAACAARLELNDVRAEPHRMDADQQGPSYCFCADDNPPTLTSGSGTDGDVRTLLLVSEVQRALKALGYFAPEVAGDPFGPQTTTAVRQFQFNVGLPTTGAVDKATWAALRRSRAEGARFCQAVA